MPSWIKTAVKWSFIAGVVLYFVGSTGLQFLGWVAQTTGQGSGAIISVAPRFATGLQETVNGDPGGGTPPAVEGLEGTPQAPPDPNADPNIPPGTTLE